MEVILITAWVRPEWTLGSEKENECRRGKEMTGYIGPIQINPLILPDPPRTAPRLAIPQQFRPLASSYQHSCVIHQHVNILLSLALELLDEVAHRLSIGYR